MDKAELRIPPIPIVEAIFRPALDHAREVLGEMAFAAEQQRGRRLSMDDVIAEALAMDVPPDPTPEPAGRPGPMPSQGPPLPDGLSAREAEVLRLIAAGRSAREIADELVISIHTVESHITHVYQKIGARRRAEATAYALRHGLA